MRLFVDVVVSLNAMAKIPQNLHPHEIAVLHTLFGEENISVSGTPYEVDMPSLEAANEYGRLTVKYGADAVDKVYRSYKSEEFTKAITVSSKAES